MSAHALNMQSRKASDCSSNYLGMNLRACDDSRTHLYDKLNSSAAIVWLIEPAPPDAPVISSVDLDSSAAGPNLTVVVTLHASTGVCDHDLLLQYAAYM